MKPLAKSIGGYFELEIDKGNGYYPELLALNTGRNAFEYILSVRKYDLVYIPYYTCDVILEPLIRLNVHYKFYRIDDRLEIKDDIKLLANEGLLYTNYFSLKEGYVKLLVKKFKNLIIDNSQAFYSKPVEGVDTFYSPRKFFGVPDGAYLSISERLPKELVKDSSYNRCSHLLKRIDVSPEAGYEDFKENDRMLSNNEIMAMSDLTKRLLGNINYKRVGEIRKSNFAVLHSSLKSFNAMTVTCIDETAVPMIYPFFCKIQNLKDELAKNRIYVATYWPNVLAWTNEGEWEYQLAQNLICLPIDQRYDENDMAQITELIKRYG